MVSISVVVSQGVQILLHQQHIILKDLNNVKPLNLQYENLYEY